MSATTDTEFRTVDTSDRLPDDYVNPYYLGDLKRRISVARVDGKLYAFDDLCPHEACPSSAGLLTGTKLKCQWHGSQFDVTNEAVLRGPRPTRSQHTKYVKRTTRSRSASDRGGAHGPGRPQLTSPMLQC